MLKLFYMPHVEQSYLAQSVPEKRRKKSDTILFHSDSCIICSKSRRWVRAMASLRTSLSVWWQLQKCQLKRLHAQKLWRHYSSNKRCWLDCKRTTLPQLLPKRLHKNIELPTSCKRIKYDRVTDRCSWWSIYLCMPVHWRHNICNGKITRNLWGRGGSLQIPQKVWKFGQAS